MPNPQDQGQQMKNLQTAYQFLARKVRMYERIHSLFLRPTKVADNLETVMDILLEDMRTEAGSIILIDPEKNEFFFAAARGPVAEEIKKIRFPADKGIAGAAAIGRRTLAISDVNQDPRFYREITDQLGFEVRTILAVPMTFQDESIGVIELINKNEGDEYVRQEIEAVEKVAGLTAILVALGEHIAEMKGEI